MLAKLLILLILGLVWMTLPAVAQPARSPNYLLWHLMPVEGATPELTASLEKQLRSYFEKKQTGAIMNVLGMDSVLLVEGNEKYLRCGIGLECLSGLGRQAHVQWVIAGQVRRDKKRISIEMILVDTQKKQIVSHTSEEVLEQLTSKLLEELYLAMFQPKKYRGSLELSCAVAGANVYLDRKKVGVTPLIGPIQISSSTHLLEIKKPGHQPFSRKIRVPVGELKTIVALLPKDHFGQEAKTPLTKNWLFWTFGSAGLASSMTAIVLLVNANQFQKRADQRIANSLNSDYDQKKADSLSLGSYITFGIGGAALLAAGIMALVDWSQSEDSVTKPATQAVGFGVAGDQSGAFVCTTIRF